MEIMSGIPGLVARVSAEQKRRYDYDEKRGIWLYCTIDERHVTNLLPYTGIVQLHTYLYGSAAQSQRAGLGTGWNWIGLAPPSIPAGNYPLQTDVDLSRVSAGTSGEYTSTTANGLQRAQGTVTLPTGTGSTTTIAHTFTLNSAGSVPVFNTALFDSGPSIGGVMNHEVQFLGGQIGMAQFDTLTITFQISAPV